MADPLIRTRVVAGSAGCRRAVTWAHTCELADPWNWMGDGDLLMTDGYGFPAAAPAQVDFIRNLAAAGMAGVALAEGFVAPPLTVEAAQVADELEFPVLVTARSVPFVTIARVVADANRTGAGSRAAQVLRVYDVLRRVNHDPLRRETELLEDLSKELGADLNVVHLRRGRELLDAPVALEDHLREAVLALAREHGSLPGFSRVASTHGTTLVVPVGEHAAALVVRVADGQRPDLLLVQHAAMIVGLEVERRAARESRARDQSATLIRSMLEASIAPESAETQLRELGLGPPAWRVTAWNSATGNPVEGGKVLSAGSDKPWELADNLAGWPWAAVQSFVNGVFLVVVTDAQFTSSVVAHAEAAGAVVGASQPFSSASRFADAAREARWALEDAKASGESCSEYGSLGSYFMPRTVAEGEAVVTRLLGPVIDYDVTNDTDLLRSLWVYFAVNKSWQQGALRLGIHKQTLVYRLKKIEELTGADLRDFGTQAELFLALRTWRLLNHH